MEKQNVFIERATQTRFIHGRHIKHLLKKKVIKSYTKAMRNRKLNETNEVQKEPTHQHQQQLQQNEYIYIQKYVRLSAFFVSTMQASRK